MARQGRRRSPVPPLSSVEATSVRSRARGKRDGGVGADGGAKKPFDVDVTFERVEEATGAFEKAAMFELREHR
jgi:hypothetical protein